MHNPNIKIYQYLIIYIILFFLFTSKWSFELSRGWHISYLVNSCRYCTVTSIDVLWMSIPDEKLTKSVLLVQRSTLAVIDYHTMLPPPRLHASDKACKRVDMIIIKVQSITSHFFMKEKQNISIYHILWKLWQPAKFIQCLITPVLVSYKLISYLKENKKSNKLSIRYREQQNAPWYFLVRMFIKTQIYWFKELLLLGKCFLVYSS